MFSSEDSDNFDREVQQAMAQDGTRRYLHFIAMSDSSPDFNVFAVLDCNSREQVRRLVRRYFHSVTAYGVLQGRLGLKNI